MNTPPDPPATGDPERASPEEAEITLGVLTAVEANSRVTQRSMARELGIALGLANAYLKRCVRKGLVKVSEAPANRYAYYLTPQGFAEKSRLTAEYLTSSLGFFRKARRQYEEAIDACLAHGWRRIALVGAGDLAEIALLCIQARGASAVGIVDPHATETRLGGVPVVADLASLDDIDAVVCTDHRDAQGAFDRMVRDLPIGRVMTPPMLNVSRRMEGDTGADDGSPVEAA